MIPMQSFIRHLDLDNAVGRLGVDTTVSDAITTPVENTSAYSLHKTTDPIDIKGNHQVIYQCGRHGNTPTVALEQKISAIEGAESTLILAPGMSVSAVMMMALIPAGGHVVTTAECYRKHRAFIETMLPKMRITNTVIDPTDVVALESALEHHNVSLFLTESPTNPFLKNVDIKLVSELCHRQGTVLCIDATFAAPLNQKPLPLGADLILHSLTKYIGGPQDVVLGSCISGSARLVSQVQNLYHNLGGTINPVLDDKPAVKIEVLNMVDGTLNPANGITFFDEEIIPELIKHPKLLYVSANCKGYPINEVLVDPGATMNVLPLSTSTMLGVCDRDLTRSKFGAVGYDGVRSGILGEIFLPVGIECRIYRVSFQVMDMKQPPPYKMLLGTPWLNEIKAVSSPLHQCVKYKENGATTIIPGEGYPVA